MVFPTQALASTAIAPVPQWLSLGRRHEWRCCSSGGYRPTVPWKPDWARPWPPCQHPDLKTPGCPEVRTNRAPKDADQSDEPPKWNRDIYGRVHGTNDAASASIGAAVRDNRRHGLVQNQADAHRFGSASGSDPAPSGQRRVGDVVAPPWRDSVFARQGREMSQVSHQNSPILAEPGKRRRHHALIASAALRIPPTVVWCTL